METRLPMYVAIVAGFIMLWKFLDHQTSAAPYWRWYTDVAIIVAGVALYALPFLFLNRLKNWVKGSK